jgi:hypothetical protein
LDATAACKQFSDSQAANLFSSAELTGITSLQCEKNHHQVLMIQKLTTNKNLLKGQRSEVKLNSKMSSGLVKTVPKKHILRVVGYAWLPRVNFGNGTNYIGKVFQIG